MFDYLASLGVIQKSFVLMGVGIAGVFLVLIIFFLLIKLLVRLYPEKDSA